MNSLALKFNDFIDVYFSADQSIMFIFSSHMAIANSKLIGKTVCFVLLGA